jgi:hypothetical protein
MHGIAGCGKTACPVVTEGLTLATGPFYSLLELVRKHSIGELNSVPLQS